MKYRLIYSDTSRKQILQLHPQIKAAVKLQIRKLPENPFTGKMLEKELSGYLSLRTKRFRIIYKVKPDDRIVEIHYVGHRKDIYELFKENLERE
jgi:mRNA-degrading endonuclease RelE of RelBE toxin-antitoxin system